MHFADRLSERVLTKGNSLCVGIDPRWESLPLQIRQTHWDGTLDGIAKAFEVFGLKILELISRYVPVIKPQSAFFELCGPSGMKAMQTILHRAKELNLVTILDAKRNDIASTATAYADAAFRGLACNQQVFPVWDADSLTVNPYLGRDAMEPFLQSARQSKRGAFVLVRTSNPGAGLFQDLPCDGKPLYQHVAQRVAEWNRENLGACGLGDVGAVIGATHPNELKVLREMLPEIWFLVPGFGAQGGKATDVAPAFLPNGLGAIINSSRGVIFNFRPDDPNWESGVLTGMRQAIESLNAVRPQTRG